MSNNKTAATDSRDDFLLAERRGNSVIVKRCPHCKKKHIHGTSGRKAAHCATGPKALGSYHVIVPTDPPPFKAVCAGYVMLDDMADDYTVSDAIRYHSFCQRVGRPFVAVSDCAVIRDHPPLVLRAASPRLAKSIATFLGHALTVKERTGIEASEGMAR